MNRSLTGKLAAAILILMPPSIVVVDSLRGELFAHKKEIGFSVRDIDLCDDAATGQSDPGGGGTQISRECTAMAAL